MQASSTTATPAGNHVEVIEVGMRDGLQSEARIIPAQEKIALLNAMIESGVRNIEVTSFVSPKAVPQLADAVEVLAGIQRRDDTNLMALVPNIRGAERAAETAVDGAVLFCSASETHNQKNLNRSIAQTLQGYTIVAKILGDARIDLHGAIATAFGCPFEGEIQSENFFRIARAYSDLGVTHLTLGDTTGMATPVNVRKTVRALQKELPHMQVSLHLHNTRGVGLANVVVGLEEGIRRFDSSVGGLGGCPFAAGATGNICTEDLIYLLHESGYDTGIDLRQAIDVALRMERALAKPLSGQVMRAGLRLDLHESDSVATAAG